MFVAFTLKETLQLHQESGIAVNVETGETIEVDNSMQLWEGDAGFRGFAYCHDGRFLIVHMQRRGYFQ